MVQSSPKHNAKVAHDFSAAVMEMGFTEAQVFEGTGLTQASINDPNQMVPLQKIIQIIDNGVRVTGDDLLGLRFGLTRRFKHLGLIGYLGRTAANMRMVIYNLDRYGDVFSESIDLVLDKLDSDGVLAWKYLLPAKVDTDRFAELQASQFVAGANAILPRRIVPRLIEFKHQRKHNVREFERLMGCPVAFGAKGNAIHFHQADLDLPLDTHDESLNKLLQHHADLVLSQRPKNRTDIEIEVERAIADRMATGQTSVNVVARDLGMSGRTLARRLGDANTTYQTVLSNFRRAMAERYLRKSDMSQSEIAYLLGYSDVSSFASAFKRWTGQSPGELRQSAV